MSKASCTHFGPTKVGQIAKHTLCLGSFSDLETYITQGGRPWLVLNLNNQVVRPTRMDVHILDNDQMLLQAAKELELLAKFSYNHIDIDWADGGIPIYDLPFWERLYCLIAEHPGDGDVFVHCMGGHGRTGTLAAILLTLDGQVPESECPVAWLRAKYCESAVETTDQIWYVESITGRPVSSKPVSVSYSYNYANKTEGYPYSGSTFQGYSTNKEKETQTVEGKGLYETTTIPEKKNEKLIDAHEVNLPKSLMLDEDGDFGNKLYWSQTLGYIDEEGRLLGQTYSEAIRTYKERKAKQCKQKAN